jgi:hypothetical protein
MKIAIFSIALSLCAGHAGAQTYFSKTENGVVTLMEAAASNAPVPASCPGCAVVTAAQFQALSAQVQAAGRPTVIPKYAFYGRFTPAQRVAISDSDVVGIRRGVSWATTIESVDLTAPRVSAWLDFMVTAGIITAADKTAILAP